jgi:leucine dehydrogenase
MFDRPAFSDHEQVAFFCDRASGLRAIVALHSTRLGPAFGGIRMRDYPRAVDALDDALRLSRAMTLKAAVVGAPLGGGKAVILGDPSTQKTEALLQAMGRAIDSLGGRYIAAEDVGTSLADLAIVRRATRHTLALATMDVTPAPATAWGVLVALRAAVRHRLGRDDLAGLRVALQGLGKVGWQLCRFLHAEGARLVVTDIDPARSALAAAELGARVVAPEAIWDAEVEVLAPCALGGVLGDGAIARLRAGIVVGAANNQLARPGHAEALRARGIDYVPDFVANAGGVIDATHDGPGYDPARVLADVLRIGAITLDILTTAAREGVATPVIAMRLAQARLDAAGRRDAA